MWPAPPHNTSKALLTPGKSTIRISPIRNGKVGYIISIHDYITANCSFPPSQRTYLTTMKSAQEHQCLLHVSYVFLPVTSHRAWICQWKDQEAMVYKWSVKPFLFEV